jgi:hypothetical protein
VSSFAAQHFSSKHSCGLQISLTSYPDANYPEGVAKKEATGFGSPIYTWRTTALGGIFSSVPRRAFNERRWLGGLRLPVSVCTGLPTFPSLLTPFGSGVCGSKPHTEAIMVNRTRTPAESRRDTINHLRWQAKAVANLLSSIHLLPATGQEITLDTTTRLADELASELAVLLRGEA